MSGPWWLTTDAAGIGARSLLGSSTAMTRPPKACFFLWFLAPLLALAACVAACGAGSRGQGFTYEAGAGDASIQDEASTEGGGPVFGGDASQSFTISPANPALLVTVGSPVPKQTFKAIYRGAEVPATWSVDRGDIGIVGGTSGVFTPTGNVGGVLMLTATVGMAQATTNITVSILSLQNGALPGDNPGMTVGTVGEGVGGPVDGSTQIVLTATQRRTLRSRCSTHTTRPFGRGACSRPSCNGRRRRRIRPPFTST